MNRNSNQFKDKVKNIKHIFLDMDGTIYKGTELYSTTKAFLDILKQKNIGYTFLTNNSSRSREDYVVKLSKLGIDIDISQIFTSATYTINYLQEYFPQNKEIFILGVDKVIKEFEELGFVHTEKNPKAVIVCYDTSLDYEKLCKAAYWIKQTNTFISTHPDVFCPTNEPTLLVDCGAITKCLETASGVKSTVLGKPKAQMLEFAANAIGVPINKTAMAGDRLATDIAIGVNAGVFTIHIDHNTKENIPFKNKIIPDISVENLLEFGKLL
jgi:HAD superfamily hydrolase (TIGR01450 family)